MQWFDPNFNPLELLQQCEIQSKQAMLNTQQLARAHNAQESLIVELTNQHNQVIELIRMMRRDLEQLKKIQNATLKKQRNCPCETGNPD
jgi:hemerythrin-like domain-containing protein